MPTAPIKGGRADRKPRDNGTGRAARIGHAAPGPRAAPWAQRRQWPADEDERG